MTPVFPPDHPALCYERHDPNDCTEPHIHVGGICYLVEVPDTHNCVTDDAVRATSPELQRALVAAGFNDVHSLRHPNLAVRALFNTLMQREAAARKAAG